MFSGPSQHCRLLTTVVIIVCIVCFPSVFDNLKVKSIFKSMCYKKKHLIGCLYYFNQWNSVCQTALESTKIVSCTQNTSVEKCKLTILMGSLGHGLNDSMRQSSSEWDYGRECMAFLIIGCWSYSRSIFGWRKRKQTKTMSPLDRETY